MKHASSRKAVLALLCGLGLLAPSHWATAVMPIAATHPCTAKAAAQARKLVSSHIGTSEGVTVRQDAIRARNPVRSPSGKAWHDVLEIPASVGASKYRVRIQFAQGDERCTVQAQDIEPVA